MADRDEWNKKVIEEFRANKGVVGGQFGGIPILLLHTTGARTGKARINPLAYLDDGDGLYVFASKGGAPSHPDWYRNLVANPKVSVEIGTDSYDADAVVLDRADRDRVYAEQASRMPGFADYEKATDRVIPVVALKRR